jgi:curved DNA-binding protein CbpA
MHKKNNFKSEERRNYYRTLNVQPDASIEIIKNNYRTLLQKLRLHPDLGGENWNARIINEAYNTLRNPEKRAVYDKELLQRYDLKSLSRGNLDNNHNQQQNNKPDSKDKHGNQRNYYRLFNIQPDSPAHIIKTSYLTLTKDPDKPRDLLNEAYTVLSTPYKRALYDKLLKQHSHSYALTKLTTRQHENFSNDTDNQAIEGFNSASTAVRKSSVVKINSKYGNPNKSYYQPVITQYCSFCKTPHNQSPCEHTAALCNECKSPLFPPSQTFLEQQRREIIRIAKDHHVNFYAYWPGKKLTGIISDISPTGMQLVSSSPLNKDQIIKLDGEDFKAVGSVSYCNRNERHETGSLYTSGIQFITVNFNKRKGQFLSESA